MEEEEEEEEDRDVEGEPKSKDSTLIEHIVNVKATAQQAKMGGVHTDLDFLESSLLYTTPCLDLLE